MAVSPPPPPQSSTSQERRRHPRFQPLAQVQIRGGGEVAVLPIADISAGGIRLIMDTDALEDLDIDEQVSVFLEAEDVGAPVYVKVDASVVRIKRSEPAHVALEWHERSPDNVDRFEDVLRILQKSTSGISS